MVIDQTVRVHRQERSFTADPSGSTFTTWQSKLAPLFDVSLPSTANRASFEMHGVDWQLPSAFIHRARGSGQILTRSHEKIAQYPVDHVVIYLLERGTLTSTCDGRDLTMGPGDVAVFDYARAIHTSADDFTSVSIAIDRKTAPALLQTGACHGVSLVAYDLSAKLIGGFIGLLLETLDGLRIAEAEVAIEALLKMVASAFETAPTSASTSNERIRNRALTTIKARLSDPSLTPASVAAEIGVSRSRLYKSFDSGEGVSESILRLRLNAAMIDLIQSTHERNIIGRIGKRHGFKSEAHFSRVFRQRTGRSPRDVHRLRHDGNAADLGGYTEFLADNAARAGFQTVDAWLQSIGSEET